MRSRLKFAGVVAPLQPNQSFLNRFQFRGHGMQTLQTFALRLLIGEAGNIGMNLHKLQSDLLAGFLDLGDGFGSLHAATIAFLLR